MERIPNEDVKVKKASEAVALEQAASDLETPTSEALNLQQMIGNQGVQRLFSGNAKASTPTFIQAKMAVTPAGDKYEQEADQVAKQVVQEMPLQRQAMEEDELQMKRIQRVEDEELLQGKRIQRVEEEELLQGKRLQRMEEDELQMKRIQRVEDEELLQGKRLQRMEEDELQMKRIQRVEEEELLQGKRIQRQSGADGFDVSGDVEDKISMMRGGGQKLPDNVRGGIEGSMGYDFSGVNVHTGDEANQLTQALQARAFTTGKDIFFGKGEYQPENTGGQELLAHELTHVVQQGSAQPKRKDED